MKSDSKIRIKLLLIAMVFVGVLAFFGYMIWEKPKTITYTSAIKIVDVNNKEDIAKYEKYKNPYAYKEKENNQFTLKYHDYIYPLKPIDSTLILTSEKYDEIVEGNDYWFKIKFYTPDNSGIGIVKKVYTDDPARK